MKSWAEPEYKARTTLQYCWLEASWVRTYPLKFENKTNVFGKLMLFTMKNDFPSNIKLQFSL